MTRKVTVKKKRICFTLNRPSVDLADVKKCARSDVARRAGIYLGRDSTKQSHIRARWSQMKEVPGDRSGRD
jgi:hypothetical protein